MRIRCGFNPLFGVALAIAILVGLLAHLERVSRLDLGALEPAPGPLVLDRHGRILRLVPEAGGPKLIKLPPGPIPENVARAFVAAEDERFWWHFGIDPVAVLRAVSNNIRAGRIVSGASTLTMQLVRLTSPGPRTYYRKLIEMARAVRIEAALAKADILRHYLNRVPQGNNLMGVETAALAYFGRPTARLSVAEAALLAALAKAPGRLNPCGPNRAGLLARRNWVLGRMAKLGFLSPEDLQAAQREGLDIWGVGRRTPFFPFEAPHFVDLVLAKTEADRSHGLIRTTLDLTLQRRAAAIVASHRPRLLKSGATQAAALVVDNRSLEVLALVGSYHYGPRDQGFNNGALVWRSPGSALKPFLYAQALDAGFNAGSILEDMERRYRTPGGEFIPANFGGLAHGPVSFREALGNSLNLAAVNLLKCTGPENFYETLRKLQLINHPERGPEHYGLGLVVGNPEVSLLQLAAAYASVANGGLFRPLRVGLEEPLAAPRRIFSPQAAYIVNDILADPSARARIFGASTAMNPPYRLALKTGTSTRYRDCWIVGFSPRYTLAVWVGNFDGLPTAGESGATAAAPILADLAAEVFRMSAPQSFPRPEGVVSATVCSFSGLKPGPGCVHLSQELFIAGTEPSRPCTYHRRQEPWHRLATPFAGWLNRRYQKAEAGRYRLAGFGVDLQSTFEDRSGDSPGAARVHLRPGDKVTLGLGPTRIKRPLSPETRPTGTPLVSLLYPLQGDRFVPGPREETFRLTAKAMCQLPVSKLTWFVDGRVVAVTGPPYELSLTLSRGHHRLTVVGPGHLGDEVEISVQ